MFAKRKRRYNSGITLIEVIATLGVFAIFFVGLATYLQANLWSRGKIKRVGTASSLAQRKMAALLAYPPSALGDSMDGTEEIEEEGMKFKRTVDITVNSDGTKTVFVSVNVVSSLYGGSVTYTVTVPSEG
ncbi:MAG: hypothetical protein D6808_04170 [Candidatus Dadabacteria bacterium]|nr:MAG: hypothetical protein D6808_04170 [Candidatus Dadabacteria bacterium]